MYRPRFVVFIISANNGFIKIQGLDFNVSYDFDAGDYGAAFGNLVRLQGALEDFFTEVMVMHEDPDLRTNRLALLLSLRRTFETVADVSRIQVR